MMVKCMKDRYHVRSYLYISSPSSSYIQVFKHVLFNMHLEFMLKESSLSSRWNTDDMDAYEHNNNYIKELGMTMGQSWGGLKKSCSDTGASCE